MPARSNNLVWDLDDERNSCEFQVRIFYEFVDNDPGDSTTPAYGGDVILENVQVTRVKVLDGGGNVVAMKTGEAARKFDDRAWQLIDHNAMLRERIEEACSAHEFSV